MESTDISNFAAAYNDIDKHQSIADVAKALNLPLRKVREQASAIRQMQREGQAVPALIARSVTGELPLSEDPRKFKDDYTREDCIAELQRVAQIDPEQVVTRNYFRNHGRISEATWNRYFGTFEEFKRQAGIKLSRQQHAHERNIAKHASVDHYRALGEERKSYADKYDRPSDGRFKTMIVASDLHDKEIDPFFLRVLLDTTERVQPDNVVLGGDVFDLAEFGKYTVDPRDWDILGSILFAHENILGALRSCAPNAQIDLIEGNHEARMLRQLADATPALRAVLADLHGFTVGKLLGLDRYEINYVAQADLAAWTKRDQEKELQRNYKVYYDAFMVHHFPHARNFGMPGCNGHHHRHIVWSEFNPVYGAYEWHQLGAGHKRSASYCEGEKWNNGFAIVNIDTATRAVNFDYVPVSDFAVSGGKWYIRQDYEAFDDGRILQPVKH
jgi:hypothetical protein